MDETEFRVLHRIDDMDIRILQSLQADPRMPVSKIARGVGMTDNAVRYRIRRMQASGIIREFVMVLDPRLLGHETLGLVLARLRDPESLSGLVEKEAEVVGAYRTAGPFNACIFLCARDAATLQAIADRLVRERAAEAAQVLVVEDGFHDSPMPLLPAPLGLDKPAGGSGGMP